ncbi:hypothetical protein L0Y69_00305 [bacterium]|nr:hypothetical protein [bacterium]
MPKEEQNQFKILSLIFLALALALPTGIYLVAKNFSLKIAPNTLSSEDLTANVKNLVADSSSSGTLPPPETPLVPADFFSDLSLQARAIYVYDIRLDRVLYEKNAEIPKPLASLTKVMTALVASDFSADFLVEITPIAIENASSSSTTVALGEGERWNLGNLLPYTLLASSNEGANAIALAEGNELLRSPNWTGDSNPEGAFVAKMNSRAQDLGLRTFIFHNPTGLDIDDAKSGGYGSAKDVSSLFAYILGTNPEILAGTVLPRDSFTRRDGTQENAWNTNPLVASIPGLLASKTGYTDIAGGNLALAMNIGPLRPIIIVILGSTKDGRFSDAQKLIAASVKAIGQ